MPEFEYKTVKLSDETHEGDGFVELSDVITSITNRYAAQGWRTVSAMFMFGEMMFVMERVKPCV